VRHLLDTLGGLYELFRLAALTRFSLRGRYWSWRLNTAFGRGYPATRSELIAATLDYGRWVYRTRRGR
jgi:hypothetical protein